MNIAVRSTMVMRALILMTAVLWCVKVNGDVVKVLLMGDTQKITDQKGSDFLAAMDKVLTDPVTSDADFALTMGDNAEDNWDHCWQVIKEGWYKLDGKMPYVLNVGNNDRKDDFYADKFNQNFPLSKYSQWPSFVDNYLGDGDNNYANSAHRFRAGGADWLVISIWVNPSALLVGWAEDLIVNNPDDNVILVSHDANTNSDVTSMGRKHENVVFSMAGHSGHELQQQTGDNGNKLGFIRTCWHNADKDHYFRVLLLDTETGTAKFRFYSPLDEQYDGGETTWNGFTFIETPNTAPEITSTPSGLEIDEGSEFTYTLTAEDTDGDALTLSAETVPGWLDFDAATGVLSGTPSAGDTGAQSVVLSVTDGTESVEQEFDIIVSKLIVSVGPVLSDAENYSVSRVLRPGQDLRVVVPSGPGIQRTLKIINSAGEAVEADLKLVRRDGTSAEYRADLSAGNYPAGWYFIRFEVDGKKQIAKFLISN